LLETDTFSPLIVFSLIAVFSGLMRSSSGSDSPIPITRILTFPIILTPTILISLIFQTTTSISGLWIHF